MVTEALGDHLRVDASLEEQGGVRVREIGEASGGERVP